MGVKKISQIILFFLIFAFSFSEAKAPNLSPHDTKQKIQEILRSHVKFKQLTPEILKRTLQNFIEELDPNKSYFIENEVAMWLSPSDELLEKIQKEFEKEHFTAFEEIYAQMQIAIRRRNAIEEKIQGAPLPENVEISEFKELSWTLTEAQLENRLLKIRALQMESVKKLDLQSKDQFFQRIKKHRLSKEQELRESSEKEREKQMLSYVLKGLSAALDAHTLYFTPSEANQFVIQVQQRLFGIGAQLRDDLNGFSIVRILEGSPAINSSLKLGDKIIAVNQEPVVGLDIFEAVELIRGPKGSKVFLTILRENHEKPQSEEKMEIEIMRDEIVLKETRYESQIELYGEEVIGIIKLFSFYQDPNSSSAVDLKNAIERIKREYKLAGIILDLRNNAGGLLPQAASVAGLFISRGIVVSIKDSSGKIQHLRNLSKPIWDGPLLVLINRASASAAEIVAQSLQDYGRALVVGDDHSFGKGTYQTFTLESSYQTKINPQGEYKVTRGMYYTVSGKSPQLEGVKSDIIIPGNLSQLEIGEKFAKFPLENDYIAPNFEDELSDVHPINRPKIRRLYKEEKQVVTQLYDAYTQSLRRNSDQRLKNNKNHQALLNQLLKNNLNSEEDELIGNNDIQLEETINVMKDLIFLKEQEHLQPTGTGSP